jgi:hypothetical protein
MLIFDTFLLGSCKRQYQNFEVLTPANNRIDIVWSGRYLLLFRENTPPPSPTLMMEVAISSETLKYVAEYKASDRTDWSRGNVLDMYSGGSRFESRTGHQISWLKVFVVFFRSFRKMPV